MCNPAYTKTAATHISAEPISTCASGADNVCYAVGVPETTADSTTGNIYIQMSAPTSYSWVGLGAGSQEMAGANMFIMYADGTGNVTVSSRLGKGETQPLYSASTASTLQLMAGSGVSNGIMLANILCTDCKSWSSGTLSTTSTSSNWIGAWKAGSALDSTDLSETITYHDSHTSFALDLSKATIATDSNPFTSAVEATSSASTTGAVTQAAKPNQQVIWAHGLGMALAFAIFYPLGSAIMPMIGKWQIHAGWQVITWLSMWAFFGLGVFGAQQRDLPALGHLHHRHYLKYRQRGVISYIHLYWGRILIILGAINGGLGLQLTHAPSSWITAYMVIAIVVYLLYAGIKVFAVVRRRNREAAPPKTSAKMWPSSGYVDLGDEVPMNNWYAPRSEK
ncbi:CBD9-like protein [Cryphonectria parasitica EP155]|uniref:CBD9-like protein n=1 Tax=Cryphonectria parasitica (strain ATCC 38755 / EP155) TaxID=660469 RepID=A0A9P4XXB6_CRYP1|nr:CBD9-like protein [Cryphonectria parasitica EP155]KAF3762522.1 CBD9-like protein [Cryphonectria parasitica EP155]